MSGDEGFLSKSTKNAIVIGLLRQAGTRIKKEYQLRTNWTISVSADDDLFHEVNEWLIKQENIKSPRRALSVSSGYFRKDGKTRQVLRVVFDGEAANKIVVDGHDIIVSVSNPDNPVTSDREIARVVKPPKLYFRAKTRAGRDAVLAVMQDLHSKKFASERKSALYILGKYSDWSRRNDLPARTLESVVVKGGVVEEIYRDLLDFKSREEEYNRRGIPYHRAYLLTGPPGTGKTSSVKAVAQAAGMDLWYAQLSDINGDSRMIDLLSEVQPGGILLLEDIDSFQAAVSREDKGKASVTSSGLLNALDGVATPHGLVTILTTNYPEKLDSALMRPGRIDRTFSFEYPDSDTICRHFEFFYGRSPKVKSFPTGRSSAQISEIFKQYMKDPDGAELELAVC